MQETSSPQRSTTPAKICFLMSQIWKQVNFYELFTTFNALTDLSPRVKKKVLVCYIGSIIHSGWVSGKILGLRFASFLSVY